MSVRPHPDLAAGPGTRGDSFEPAALTADACLADAAEDLEFLLHVTPVNLDDAWREFAASGYETLPRMEYRRLAYDLDDMAATVAEAPVDEIEDRVVAELLSEKKAELEIKLRMLAHRGSPEFLDDSLKVYGAVEEDLSELAKRMLYRLPAVEHVEPVEGRLDAAAFAAERPIEAAVDEHRRDRLLEGARQADADVGMLRLARTVDDAPHHRHAQVLGARMGRLPLGHPLLEIGLDLLGHLLEERRGRPAAARAGADLRQERA